ncbi:MAG TPA: HEAT repeat domain-containing protein [Anaerolineae bacterium]|nr:HEAT repeat domain-containing protein [Anaerolineae bacterium]
MTELQFILNELTSGDDDRAEVVVPHVARLGTTAVDSLLALLESSSSDHRWWATRALAVIDHPQAQDGIQRALGDHDPAVRQCAALCLRLHPTPSAISTLVNALHDRDRLVARLAADALVAIGPVAIQALSMTMESPDPGVRIEAVRALAAMEDPQAIHALFAALDDPSPLVGYWAEQGLERLGVGMVFFKP